MLHLSQYSFTCYSANRLIFCRTLTLTSCLSPSAQRERKFLTYFNQEESKLWCKLIRQVDGNHSNFFPMGAICMAIMDEHGRIAPPPSDRIRQWAPRKPFFHLPSCLPILPFPSSFLFTPLTILPPIPQRYTFLHCRVRRDCLVKEVSGVSPPEKFWISTLL